LNKIFFKKFLTENNNEILKSIEQLLIKGKQMSHTVMAEFHCNEGMGELLVPGLMESLSDTRAFDGCESVETYVDQDDPDRVYLWEKWTTRENYEKYIAWRIETGMLEALAPVLVKPMTPTHLSPQD
jgi:quinol monooxygenase YgiN